MDIQRLINELTVEEKAALVSGCEFMHTNPVPRLGIPGLCFADGPHGLRKQTARLDNGVSMSEPATAFPTAVTVASSWNPENARLMGAAIAEECRHYGVSVLLGPGVNIKRNPLCGRNFEYFSEDPLLSGKMGAAEVAGLDSCGVGASVKHFAANNTENFRYVGESVADTRALREIYLRSFERVIKESAPATVMSAYNALLGDFCSENKRLINDILREEWGFDGLVMTDWGAIRDRVKALKAGTDLEMPGDTPSCRRAIIDAVADGSLDISELDRATERVLRLIKKYKDNEICEPHFDEHDRLAADIAADSAVLLKNDGALPLSSTERICVIGELFERTRYQGSGSSMINATRVLSPKDAFDSAGIEYTYSSGYRESTDTPDEALEREAVALTEECDKVLLFLGLTDTSESESADREHMRLPENQLALAEKIIGCGRTVVAVLYGGSPFELSFRDKLSSVLLMYLPGQSGGLAAYELLYGIKNPSGRLAESWPESYTDVPFGDEFGKGAHELYRESVFVGYRYYTTSGIGTAYPFGHGLSYTVFEYSSLSVKADKDTVRILCEVKNAGERGGNEVIQVYSSKVGSRVFRPKRELRAFTKISLLPGEAKSVELAFPISDLAYYDTARCGWVIEGGEYGIHISKSAEADILSERILVEGDAPEVNYSDELLAVYGNADIKSVTPELFRELLDRPIPPVPQKLPITTDSRVSDMDATFFGRFIIWAVLSLSRKQRRKARRMPEGKERDNTLKGAKFLERIMTTSTLRSISMTSEGALPYNCAEALAELANGKILKAIGRLLRPYRAPKLPKDEKR